MTDQKTSSEERKQNPKPVGVAGHLPPKFQYQLERLITRPIFAALIPFFESLDTFASNRLAWAILSAACGQQLIVGDAEDTCPLLDRNARTAASGHVERVKKWHDKRTLETFRAAGLDIDLLASESFVREALRARVFASVDLIKTIPRRMHDSLAKRLAALARSQKQFDPRALKRILRQEFRSTGYNLRRLTRDQTTKQLGEMTRIRQTQAGFTHYIWVTAGDDRVRDTHADNDGQKFAWAQAPVTGHPGDEIQCRCQAEAHVSRSDIELAITAL